VSEGNLIKLDQSIWLGAICLSKYRTPRFKPKNGSTLRRANKIVTEIGGVVKKNY
jgi:hypothetical protein